MKRYTAAQARQKFSNVLDAAEQGETVVIERRGVRFGVRAEEKRRRTVRSTSTFESIDPAVESGKWRWTWAGGGLRFSAKKSDRR